MAKRALVLAGGGSRGSYHIGVWAALREIGWQPDIVTGTSVGALSGAAVVSGEFERARLALTSVTDEDIVKLPKSRADLPALRRFVFDISRHGGLDVGPLERLLRNLLDEEQLRNSPVDFGIVVVRKKGMRPVELTLDEIPRGKLHDYLLASAAAYPYYRPRRVGNDELIDGGYYDNLPIGLAEDMGAEEVIAVDLRSIGIVRAYTGGLPVRYIRSHWPLGPTHRFIPAREQRNYRLGYLDTMKSFRRFDGKAYAFEKGTLDAFLERHPRFTADCTAHFQHVEAAPASAVPILRKRADIHRNRRNMLVALAETAGEVMGVSPERSYTFSDFNDAILESADAADILRLDPAHLSLNLRSAAKTMAAAVAASEYTPLLQIAVTGFPKEFIAGCYIAELQNNR